ncbi:hypothetical protein Mp_1g20100 [Marchantia polymorpha subsp. ruderalis]|uniref:Uncharacterized protein n=2 Tax=Marchantia polymorpha TaxID=3197 RepID=A0AAF6AS53_MARPO|nr:hypothetical protein MARPO_0001s0347 [Marchantia polymorpha]BBM99273.1 hypothetical protein Mp_1g20100 [Marchantia polymorpha subsp. ruderalis]|eukprot:PTQ50355.1 hypothetical protein MARPO_0001s0347 [Marchantia polymorpha]
MSWRVIHRTPFISCHTAHPTAPAPDLDTSLDTGVDQGGRRHQFKLMTIPRLNNGLDDASLHRPTALEGGQSKEECN